eukprot:TRINITY_DN4152_c0_g1_i1.p1 TRINITY_DN4152_c0_g1~~TRINITY_DN4152_c0_g1_i1.p1  ORF type:complete len:299 (+),score=116.86 TRINITY_DN4152_c0_g1_i1:69-965(+)
MLGLAANFQFIIGDTLNDYFKNLNGKGQMILRELQTLSGRDFFALESCIYLFSGNFDRKNISFDFNDFLENQICHLASLQLLKIISEQCKQIMENINNFDNFFNEQIIILLQSTQIIRSSICNSFNLQRAIGEICFKEIKFATDFKPDLTANISNFISIVKTVISKPSIIKLSDKQQPQAILIADESMQRIIFNLIRVMNKTLGNFNQIMQGNDTEITTTNLAEVAWKYYVLIAVTLRTQLLIEKKENSEIEEFFTEWIGRDTYSITRNITQIDPKKHNYQSQQNSKLLHKIKSPFGI